MEVWGTVGRGNLPFSRGGSTASNIKSAMVDVSVCVKGKERHLGLGGDLTAKRGGAKLGVGT